MSNSQNQDKVKPSAQGKFNCKTFYSDEIDSLDEEIMDFMKFIGMTKDKLETYQFSNDNDAMYVHIAWFDDNIVDDIDKPKDHGPVKISTSFPKEDNVIPFDDESIPHPGNNEVVGKLSIGLET